MEIFGHFFNLKRKDTPDLLAAIERAVNAVEPQLMQTHKYPDAFRKPVMNALEYARSLAHSVPGPVTADLDAYAHNAFVHAIFPSMEVVSEAFRTSRAMQEYLHANPSINEIYALMGMRRKEKSMIGMKISGQVIQRDVPQKVVYFISHTVENPAPSEEHAREQVAWAFFDRLVRKVAERVSQRKEGMLRLREEKDVLMARLHAATPGDRPALEAEFSKMLSDMQTAGKAMDLHNYPDDFKAIMLNPEEHLRMNQFHMALDSMGIRHDNEESDEAKQITFNELVGYDRRDWVVTMVHCRDMQSETFAARLETAYRRLSI